MGDADMVVVTRTYVREDDSGAQRVGAADVSLDSVVIAFQDGLSAETIQQQYPVLSLAEVYGAITFYLANRDEVHAYLDKQQQRWHDLRAQVEQTPSSVVERLRALHRASQEHG